MDEINPFNVKKASQATHVPVPIIKGNKDIALFIYHHFKNSLSSSSFLTGLKYADESPVFKKDGKTDNYCKRRY